VAVDSFSRFVMAKAIKSTKAEETAQFILEIGATFGLPSSIRSDNARAPFLNELMTALLRLVNVDRKAAIAYLPRSNGIVERWIGELTKHLKYLVVGAGLKERWSDYLPLAVRILNATRTAGIGCAPAETGFGGRVHLNRELLPTGSRPY
jgi:transposase InsO family protein